MAQSNANPYSNPHRDPAGTIAQKYGSMKVATLRRAYGDHFALGAPGWKTLDQVLTTLDEPSLAKLVWDTPGA